jgi:hypothetical protein
MILKSRELTGKQVARGRRGKDDRKTKYNTGPVGKEQQSNGLNSQRNLN